MATGTIKVIGSYFESPAVSESTESVSWRVPLSMNVPNGIYVVTLGATKENNSGADGMSFGVALNNDVLSQMSFEKVTKAEPCVRTLTKVLKITSGVINAYVYTDVSAAIANIKLTAVKII